MEVEGPVIAGGLRDVVSSCQFVILELLSVESDTDVHQRNGADNSGEETDEMLLRESKLPLMDP